jgi:hypothetical protein
MINMNALADRIDELVDHGPDEAFRIISGEFPGVTVRQFQTAAGFAADRARAEGDRQMAEADALEQLHELCRPVFEDGRAKTVGEAIEILAAEGDETAKALKAQLTP